MKKLISMLLAITVLLSLHIGVASATGTPSNPSILLDGLPLEFDVPPRIMNGRTMVPFRAIAEALGIEVLWNESNRSIQAFGPDLLVYLRIDVPTMWVNGTAVELDVPPTIVDSRTLLPLRAFTTAFGAEVGWDPESYTVNIKSPVRPMTMLGFYALGSFPRRHLVPEFSHMAYGWSQFNADGSLNLTGIDYYWPDAAGEVTPESLLADAAAAGTRRYLMVHNLDKDLIITNLVLDAARIEHAADSVAELVNEKGFDGVLLDLEQLGWSERGEELERVRQGFVNLVTAVSQRMHAEGKEIIVSVPPLNGWYHGYDYAALAPVVDAFQMMAHDYVTKQPEPADRVEEAIQWAVEAVGTQNRSKLLLGVQLYETPETLVQKVGLAKRYNLGGISYWFLRELSDQDMAALNSTITPRK